LKGIYFITIKINFKKTILSLALLAFILILMTSGISKSISVFFTGQPYRRIVVIDPGHGGVDGGTGDGGSLLEKNINLDIALRVKRNLDKKNILVFMTRVEDVSLESKSKISTSRYRRDLDGRKVIIDKSNGDAFVSIHVNADRNAPNARGAIAFYYRTSEEGKLLAEKVGNSIDKIVYRKYLKNESLSTEIDSQDLFVLRETKIPGILLEVGFITNSEDKKLLKDDRFKEKMALAIAEGLIEYFK